MKELRKIVELCPFLLPIDTRFLVFRDLMRSEFHEYGHGDRNITVHRGREFEDAMAQLYHRDIKGRLHIRFINQFGKDEIGMDAGGLTKEFLTRIFK
jgi:ubiquitin-protein ligase E3 C